MRWGGGDGKEEMRCRDELEETRLRRRGGGDVLEATNWRGRDGEDEVEDTRCRGRGKYRGRDVRRGEEIGG